MRAGAIRNMFQTFSFLRDVSHFEGRAVLPLGSSPEVGSLRDNQIVSLFVSSTDPSIYEVIVERIARWEDLTGEGIS